MKLIYRPFCQKLHTLAITFALTLIISSTTSYCGGTDNNSAGDKDTRISQTLSANLNDELTKAGVSAEQAETISDAGSEQSLSGSLDTKTGLVGRLFNFGDNPPEDQMPLFSEGAIGAIDEAGISDALKYRVAAIIVAVVINSISEIQDLAQISFDSSIMEQIAALSTGALDEGGFAANEIANAVQKIAGQSTGVFDDAGFSGASIEEMLQAFSSGAVAGLGRINADGFDEAYIVASAGRIGAGMVGGLASINGLAANNYGEYAGIIAGAGALGLPNAGINTSNGNFGPAMSEINSQAIGGLAGFGLGSNQLQDAVGLCAAHSAGYLGQFGANDNQFYLDNLQFISAGATLGLGNLIGDEDDYPDFLGAMGQNLVGAFGTIGLPEEFYDEAAGFVGGAFQGALDGIGIDGSGWQSNLEAAFNSGFQAISVPPPPSYVYQDFDDAFLCPPGVIFDAASGICLFDIAALPGVGGEGGAQCFAYDFDPNGCQTQTQGECIFDPLLGLCNPADLAAGDGGCFGFGPGQCQDAPGCFYDNEADLCVSEAGPPPGGGPTGCAVATTAGECNGFPGCLWDGSHCVNEFQSCEAYSSGSECESTPGCKWDGTFCVSEAAQGFCEDLGQNACNNDPGCEWHNSGPHGPECVPSGGGGAFCEGFAAPGECDPNPGCAWKASQTMCVDAFAYCPTVSNLGNCDAHPSCEVDGGVCIVAGTGGGGPACPDIPDQPGCDGDPNCAWNGSSCVDALSFCPGFGGDSVGCNSHPSCHWDGSQCVAGNPPACNSFSDADSCAMAGPPCIWEAGTCQNDPGINCMDYDGDSTGCNGQAPWCVYETTGPPSNACLPSVPPCSDFTTGATCPGGMCNWTGSACEFNCSSYGTQAECDNSNTRGSSCTWSGTCNPP